jgi:hypothetical protein|tara:strand:+ start:362 stop:745 length:384 start_codon:yes stop_codon:yes gene_type:complete
MSWGTKETYIYFHEYKKESDNSACAWPASKFLGINPFSAIKTDIYFEALTGHANIDQIRVTHSSGKYKELCEALAVALNSDKNSIVVFAEEDIEDKGTGPNIGNSKYDLLSIKLGVGIEKIVITFDT